MFLLGYSGCAYDSIHLISLRCCECGNAVMIDTNNFKKITDNYVILKKGVNVVCDKCGGTQPKNERYLPLEPQIINRPVVQSQQYMSDQQLLMLESCIVADSVCSCGCDCNSSCDCGCSD